jgi:hypothetical protein
MPYSNSSEREFLQLAGTYLACRWEVMGHLVEGAGRQPVTTFRQMEWPMLGMVDYQREMRAFVKQWKVNPYHSERAR